MSNKPKSSKTNITKISARPATAQGETNQSHEIKAQEKPTQPVSSQTVQTNKLKQSSRKKTANKPIKSVFILARPFVKFGRYLRDSWRELRQVRWPNRKMTWKMTTAVLIYCAIFIIFITLLDVFFTFIFDLLINTN